MLAHQLMLFEGRAATSATNIKNINFVYLVDLTLFLWMFFFQTALAILVEKKPALACIHAECENRREFKTV